MDAENRKRHATLRDVAQAAGVSTMTVSNVLLGRTTRMSPQTKQRIEAEIARLDYRPNSTARGLRTAAWQSIGMLIVDDSPTFLTGRFMTNIVSGLSNHLNGQGHTLVLQGTAPAQIASALFVRDIRTDGICSAISGSDAARRATIEVLLQLRQPILLFQETLRFPGSDYCTVSIDNRGGGRMVAEAVVKAGARTLVMLVPQVDWPGIAERIAGVSEVAETAGARLRVVRSPNAGFDAVQRTVTAEIERHGVPDALLAANDQMGIAALKLLQRQGLEIPRDVLVTGFNGFEILQYTDPVLTSIRSPAYEMGVRCAQEMLHRLQTGRFSAPEIVLPVSFLPGGST
jgi:LacI family transcriptional regulator